MNTKYDFRIILISSLIKLYSKRLVFLLIFCLAAIQASSQYNCNGISPCDNLVCFNGFEDYPLGQQASIHSDLGGYWLVDGYDENLPTICGDESNQYVLFKSEDGINRPVLVIPLLEPIPSGCQGIVEFRGSRTYRTFETLGQVQFLGSEHYPCLESSIKNSINCDEPTVCGLNQFTPLCIGEHAIAVPEQMNQSCNLGEEMFSEETFQFTNTYDVPLNYLIITHVDWPFTDWIALDDLVVRRECEIDAEFSWNIQSCNVRFDANFQARGYNHEWEFGNGLGTSTSANPDFTFTESGTYEITHTLYTDCGSETHTASITVECNSDRLCACEDPDYNIGSPGEITYISDLPLDSDPDPSRYWINNVPCLSIEGTLIIDIRTNFGTIPHINMGPGALIEVEPNVGNFVISACHLQGCDKLWKGINVPANANFSLIFSFLDDAEIGVNSRSGSTFSGFHSTYNNNYIAHQVEGFVGPGDQTTGPVNNIYMNDDELLPHYNMSPGSSPENSLVGIKLLNARFFWVGTILYPGGQNHFIGLPGIHADKSLFSVHNNEFTDIVWTNWALNNRDRAIDVRDGIISGIVENKFDNCSRDIRGVGSNLSVSNCNFIQDDVVVLNSPSSINIINSPIKQISVSDSYFKNYETKLRIQNSLSLKKINFIGNEIRYLGNTNVFSAEIGHPRYFGDGLITDNEVYRTVMQNPTSFFNSNGGRDWIIRDNYTELRMYLSGIDRSLIKNNVMDLIVPNFSFSSSIFLNGAMDNLLCCNSIDNAGEGISVLQMSNATLIRGTTFKNNVTGMILRSGGTLGPQTHGGNDWSQSPNLDARNQGITAASMFIVHPSLLPDNVIPAINWFLPNPDAALNTCAEAPDCNESNWLEQIEEMDRMTAEDEFINLPDGIQIQWTSDLRLYTKVAENNSFLLDQQMQTFYQEMQNSEVAQIYELQRSLEAAYAENSLTQQQDLYFAQLNDIKSTIYALYQDLVIAAEEDVQSILNEINDLGINSEEEWQSYVDLNDEINAKRKNDLDALLGQIQTSEMSTEMGHTWKSIYSYYIRYQLLESFSTSEISDISDLAHLCPMQHGRAVYIAQTLHDLLTNQTQNWENMNLCSGSNERRSDSGLDELHDITVTPNPARSQIDLSWGLRTGHAELQIYNFNGKLLYHLDIIGQTQESLDISKWQNGKYLIRLSGPDKVSTGSFIKK